MSTTVNLNAASPAIQVLSNATSGYPISVYINKGNIVKVSGVKSKVNLQADGTFNGYKWEVVIDSSDGSREKIDIADVTNQGTWAASDAGLNIAISAIAQSV
jgi:hypothetical protein